MRIGRLRHLVRIQQQVQGRDADGAVTTSWADLLVNEPADITPVSGREFMAAQAAQSEVSARIVIRYRPDITVTAAMRVVHDQDGTTYNIRAVLPDPSLRRYVTLMVQAGVNDGR